MDGIVRAWHNNAGGRPQIELIGGVISSGASGGILTPLVYGPAIAIDASQGDCFVVSVTDAVAFVFGVPSNAPPPGFIQTMSIRIRNTSGGVHGAGSFNAIFKTSAAVPAIANGFSRTFSSQWDGTNWVEVFRTAADVAN